MSNTGLKTKSVFESAIDNLYRTVVSATLENNRFLAQLAINIMDRNLYERANDCRWWALTSEFRKILAKGVGAGDAERMGAILSYINSLYTVYTNLMVFDAEGRVVAVSQPEQSHLVGRVLTESWVRSVLSLQDSQAYAVSDFRATPLYDGQPTYVYGAAILHPEQGTPVGGIGIVFDSTPQFATILQDAFPDGKQGFGLIMDMKGRIVSSTHPDIQPGGRCSLDLEQVLRTGTGIMTIRGARYAVGIAHSQGYREYKGEHDAYRNALVACMFTRIGAQVDEVSAKPTAAGGRDSLRFEGQGVHHEIATFCVGNVRVGVRAQAVVEAVDANLLTRIPVGNSIFGGYLRYNGRPLPVVDLTPYLGTQLSEGQQAIIFQVQECQFAVLVDGLESIADIPESVISPIQLQSHLVESLVMTEGGN